jgi:hypothetical protein
MSPFQAIQYVGTPIALVAFIVAIAAYVYRHRLVERRKLIETAPEAERARLLDATLRDFTTVNTDTLTKDQRYQLAQRLIDERAARTRITAISGVVVALILAGVVLALPDPGAAQHSLVVRVSDPAGGFVTSGSITLDAGALRDTRSIGADGQVRFENVPEAAYGAGVTLHPQVPGFASSPSTLDSPPASGVHYLRLERTTSAVHGTVVDSARAGVPGVVITFDGGTAVDTTDAQGTFRVALPQPPGARVAVRATRNGQVGYNDLVTIPAQDGLTIFFAERQ